MNIVINSDLMRLLNGSTQKPIPVKQSEALVAMYCIELSWQHVECCKNSEVLTAVTMKREIFNLKRLDNVKFQKLN
jgi:hypothetical protein